MVHSHRFSEKEIIEKLLSRQSSVTTRRNLKFLFFPPKYNGGSNDDDNDRADIDKNDFVRITNILFVFSVIKSIKKWKTLKIGTKRSVKYRSNTVT